MITPMARYDPKLAGMDTLLDLHRETMEVGGGWWVTIRAERVAASEGIPHGIRYALSLHTPRGRRVVGYDNAHAAHKRGPLKLVGAKKVEFDHRHYRGNWRAYEFVSPEQLLADFWTDVEKVLKEEGVRDG